MDAPRDVPAPIRPAPAPADVGRRSFRHGRTRPKAVPWFGIRSFYGHVWHLAASAIATQDIDSRDWMHPDAPASLTRAVTNLIDPAATEAGSITAALGRDLIIDYVADTGDDVEVSRAVAGLLVRPYLVPAIDAPGELTLPRGDVLIFGGDTAYPVATSTEIESRLTAPFNEVLRANADGKTRPLLGIPGNHDWYDGLDGFARMFRARSLRLAEEPVRTSPGAERPVKHLVSWIEAFAMGKHVVKRRALPLEGYEPVQRASYFALSLAPGLDLWGVDRQLRQVNFRQRLFFWDCRSSAPSRALLLCLPDPLRAYLSPHRPGLGMLRSLGLDVDRDPMLCIAGDSHHYERWQLGRCLHIVAGGGGAFLHGAPVARRRKKRLPIVEFPGPIASRALLGSIPFRVAFGGAGLIPHVLLGVLFAPLAMGVGFQASHLSNDAFSLGAAAAGAVICSLIGGSRKRTFPVVLVLSIAVGLALGAVPIVAQIAFAAWGPGANAPWFAALVIYACSVLAGAFVFGAFLAALALFGLNTEQAFTSLSHPGYKHFVRMRVHADGSAVDVYAIGMVDPLGDPTPVLIDHARFRIEQTDVTKAEGLATQTAEAQ